MSRIHIARQTIQTECGLCAVSMVASYYDFNQPISFYRNKFNIGRDGTSINELCKIMQNIGLKSTIIRESSLLNFKFKDQPYILYLEHHFVVIDKVKGNKAVVYDPAIGKRKIFLNDFDKLFGGVMIEVEQTEELIPSKVAVGDFHHLYKVVLEVKGKLIISLLLSCLVYVISLYIPLLMQKVMDSFSERKSLNNLTILYEFLMIMVLFFIASVFRNNQIAKFQVKLSEKLSVKTITHILNIPYSYFDNRSTGNVMFRFNLLTNIENVISATAVKVIIGVTSIFVISTYLAIYYLALLPLVVIATIIIGVYVFVSTKYMLNASKNQLMVQEQLNNMQTEIVTDIFQIKCMDLSSFFLNSYKVKFENFKHAFYINQKKLSLFSLTISIFDSFLPMGLVILLVLTTSNASYSIGQLFVIYTLLSMYLNNANGLFAAVSQIHLLKGSLFYINDLIDEPVEENTGEEQISVFESINVKDLDFRYNDNQDFILSKLDFNVNRGEKVAIIGTSGSGKTTFVKLLSILYRPSFGEININNISLKSISNESYKQYIAIVPQQPIVFNKTIKSNVCLDDPAISEDDIIQALKLANIWEEIKKMPMGLNTMISGPGGNLSGGQIQRITLARALAKKPQLLILDEATSSLDSENEVQIYKNLKNANITLITISHRLSTIADSDQIFVMEQGRFTEKGTHEQLILQNGLYSFLFSSQQKIVQKAM